MKHFILFYTTVEGYVEKRAPYRAEHLALVLEYKKAGHIVLAGALKDPVDGAVLVFHVEDPEIIKEFVKKDPYVIHGLILRWDIREWTTV